MLEPAEAAFKMCDVHSFSLSNLRSEDKSRAIMRRLSAKVGV